MVKYEYIVAHRVLDNGANMNYTVGIVCTAEFDESRTKTCFG